MTNGPIKRSFTPDFLNPKRKIKKGGKRKSKPKGSTSRRKSKPKGSTSRDYRGIEGVLEDAQKSK